MTYDGWLHGKNHNERTAAEECCSNYWSLPGLSWTAANHHHRQTIRSFGRKLISNYFDDWLHSWPFNRATTPFQMYIFVFWTVFWTKRVCWSRHFGHFPLFSKEKNNSLLEFSFTALYRGNIGYRLWAFYYLFQRKDEQPLTRSRQINQRQHNL